MSKDQQFALATVFVSGLFSLMVSLSTSLLTNKRESRTFRRQLHRDKIEATRTLYQEALSVLELHARQGGRTDDAWRGTLVGVRARLSLAASKSVQSQFRQTSEVLDEATAEHVKSQPRELGGGYQLIESGRHYDKHEREAAGLYSKYEGEFLKLQAAMVEHLTELEKGLA
ncbi:MAG: hypothetical protein LC785_06015 [Acidobacteria bacterium]|nr:hypothetical protein [Acidobacteriota bacterium]MCA1641501.1 hypothetical protein [Acidobacteriota bacterium]